MSATNGDFVRNYFVDYKYISIVTLNSPKLSDVTVLEPVPLESEILFVNITLFCIRSYLVALYFSNILVCKQVLGWHRPVIHVNCPQP